MDQQIELSQADLSQVELSKEDLKKFEELDESLKNKAVIIIPGNGVNIVDAYKLITHAMKPYNDQNELKPYIVASFDEAMDEYTEDVDLYNDFDEFCLKNYGGYTDGQNVMSTINYDTTWSFYKVLNIYGKGCNFDSEMEKSLDNISFVIDQNYARRDGYKNDSGWQNKVKSMVADSIDSCYIAFVEYT